MRSTEWTTPFATRFLARKYSSSNSTENSSINFTLFKVDDKLLISMCCLRCLQSNFAHENQLGFTSIFIGVNISNFSFRFDVEVKCIRFIFPCILYGFCMCIAHLNQCNAYTAVQVLVPCTRAAFMMRLPFPTSACDHRSLVLVLVQVKFLLFHRRIITCGSRCLVCNFIFDTCNAWTGKTIKI